MALDVWRGKLARGAERGEMPGRYDVYAGAACCPRWPEKVRPRSGETGDAVERADAGEGCSPAQGFSVVVNRAAMRHPSAVRTESTLTRKGISEGFAAGPIRSVSGW